MWMYAPIAWKLTSPTSHNTSKITKIVHNIGFVFPPSRSTETLRCDMVRLDGFRLPEIAKIRGNHCKGMRFAIQGEAGAFSHEAALQVNSQATVFPGSYSSEVFRLLEQGEVDAAVIPIENSLAGPVVEHSDLLLRHDVVIESESLLRI